MPGLPRPLVELIHCLTRLPGIGPKAAERLALALLRWEPAEVAALSAALSDATARVSSCPQCGCLAQDGELCDICADPTRDSGLICVVETALDALALERGGSYSGVYHVLGGALSPLRGVLPEDLNLAELLARVRAGGVREVIVATNASPDGEATALYLKQVLEELTGDGDRQLQPGDPAAAADTAAADRGVAHPAVRVTRLARGLPSGGQLDYADPATLQSALEHRTEL